MRVHRLNPIQNARTNMVLSQLKPNGVIDRTILNVLNNVPRENFIPVNSFSIAYADAPIFYDIPGRYIFAPQTFGLFLQNLNLKLEPLLSARVFKISKFSKWYAISVLNT